MFDDSETVRGVARRAWLAMSGIAGQRDIPMFMEFLTDDVVFRYAASPEVLPTTEYHGRHALQQLLTHEGEPLAVNGTIDPQSDLVAVGPALAVIHGWETYRVVASQQWARDRDFVLLFRFRGNRISSITHVQDFSDFA